MIRCGWVPVDDPLYVAYHDEEWGIPVRDERALFELLNLEGAQAGLSWSTILRKREGYRNAFAGWDIEAIAGFGERDVERLLGDAGIVRHRGKIESVIDNARTTLALDVPLTELLWSFVGGEPKVNAWRTVGEIPAQTAESQAMSKELKRRGFRFTGPTTCYAFMQSAGLVDDHTARLLQASADLIFSTAAASASSPPPAALPTASATSSTNDLYASTSSGAFASSVDTADRSASSVPDSISCGELCHAEAHPALARELADQLARARAAAGEVLRRANPPP